MAEKPSAEKTEQPTQKRLDKAREEGQVAQSQELPAVASVVVLTGVLALTAPSLLSWFTTQMRQGLLNPPDVFTDTDSFVRYFNIEIGGAIVVSLPLMTSLFIVGVLSSIVVSGLNFAPQALKPKLSEIDPVKGFGKLFNIKSLVKLVISIAKIIVISLVVWQYLKASTETMAALRWADS